MPTKSPGRPSRGLKESTRPLNVYLDRALVRELDRFVDQRELETGKATSRHDLIREALEEYVRKLKKREGRV